MANNAFYYLLRNLVLILSQNFSGMYLAINYPNTLPIAIGMMFGFGFQ
jgi:hypothetical protein